MSIKWTIFMMANAALSFGLWQQSYSAGIFMFSFFAALFQLMVIK